MARWYYRRGGWNGWGNTSKHGWWELSMLYCEAIKRQPADLSRVLEEARPVAAQAAERLAQATRLYLCGVGTSFHAAQVGEALFRAFGVDAWAVHSFDFAVHPPPLSTDHAVLVISHEGTTTYSVEAMHLAERRAGKGDKLPAQAAGIILSTSGGDVAPCF